MKKSFILWTTAFMLLLTHSLGAQTPKALKVTASGVFHNNKAILRWAPADYDTWQWCNSHGYTVERVTTVIDGKQLSEDEKNKTLRVLDKNITPFPENDWKSIADVYPIAAIGASALYSPSFIVQAGGQSEYMVAYNKTLEKENRYNFILFAADQEGSVARAAGFFFEDENIQSNEQYQYRIIPNLGDDYIPRESGYINIDPSQTFELPVIQGLEVIPGDKKANVKWSKSNLDKFFSSYTVERSEKPNDGFKAINQEPIVPMSSGEKDPFMYFPDALASNGKPYYYRVFGKSPFGFSSEPTEAVEVIGKPMALDVSPSIYQVKEVTKGKLTVYWNFPQEKLKQIKSYTLFRSEDIDGKYELVAEGIDVYKPTYEDANIQKPAYYYIVRAIDENDYELNSFAALGQLKDDQAPAPPTGLKCTTDKSGKVSISWNQNSENDILGYRVLFANNPDAAFTQLTKTNTISTTYEDQLPLNVLNDLIYYKVLAVDYHQNYSELSEVCTMARPDVIAPNEPTLKQAEATMEGVLLAWCQSKSPDLARHELQRKADFESDWKILSTFLKQSTIMMYTDSTPQKSYVYRYRVLAFDNAQNASSSNVLQAIPIRDPAKSTGNPTGNTGNTGNTGGNGTTPTPIKGQITATPFFAPDYIELSWNYTISTGNEYFVIYRTDSLSKTALYLAKIGAANVGVKNLFTYQDNNVQQGITYTYEVQICGVQKNCVPFGSATLLYSTKAPVNNNTNKTINITAYTTAKPAPGVNFNWIYYPTTTSEYMEIYRSQAGTGKALLAGTVKMTGKNYNWTYYDNVASGSYDYQFKLCDGQAVNCPSLAQEITVEYATKVPEASVIKSQTPNYIEVQWYYDNPLAAGQNFTLERTDANNVTTTVGTTTSSTVPNGDYKIKDTNVTIGQRYQYNIKLCTTKGACTPVYPNIGTQY